MEIVESISYDGTSDAEKNELPWLRVLVPPAAGERGVCCRRTCCYHREYQENEVLVCLEDQQTAG